MLENAGKIANFSFRYEKVNKTDSLQPSCCNGPLVIEIAIESYKLYVILS